MISINIRDDYTDTPGGRYKTEGEFSGEDFRDTILITKYKEAVETKQKLFIDFDGCFGFGTSFLEEAFGGLVREYDQKNVWKRLVISSTVHILVILSLYIYIIS